MREMTPKRRTSKGGNWTHISNRIFELEYALGKPCLIAIYLYLCRRADQNQICFPSQELISKEVGASVRKVKSIIRDLASLHLIVIKRTHYRHKTRNTYLLTDSSEWIMRSAPHALRSVHLMPPNKIQKNNKKIYKKEKQEELLTMRAQLATKMTLSNKANGP